MISCYHSPWVVNGKFPNNQWGKCALHTSFCPALYILQTRHFFPSQSSEFSSKETKDVGGNALQTAGPYPFTLSGYDKVSHLNHRSTPRPYSLDMINEIETTGAPGAFKAFPCGICQECIKLAWAGCPSCCSSMKFGAGQPRWFGGWQALSSTLLHKER